MARAKRRASATGANQPLDIELAVRFSTEVAKAFGEGKCPFYDRREFKKLVSLSGSLEHLRKPKKQDHPSPGAFPARSESGASRFPWVSV